MGVNKGMMIQSMIIKKMMGDGGIETKVDNYKDCAGVRDKRFKARLCTMTRCIYTGEANGVRAR